MESGMDRQRDNDLYREIFYYLSILIDKGINLLIPVLLRLVVCDLERLSSWIDDERLSCCRLIDPVVHGLIERYRYSCCRVVGMISVVWRLIESLIHAILIPNLYSWIKVKIETVCKETCSLSTRYLKDETAHMTTRMCSLVADTPRKRLSALAKMCSPKVLLLLRSLFQADRIKLLLINSTL